MYNRTNLICTIILIVIVGNSIIKHIELRYASFIGSKSLKYVVYFRLLSIVQHILIESILIILSRLHSRLILISGTYMFVALYIIFKNILQLRLNILDKKKDIEVIQHIDKVAIKYNKIKTSKLKVLTIYNSKIDFEITSSDAIRIKKLLEEQAIISKIHYYKPSGRLYGIEILKYDKEV